MNSFFDEEAKTKFHRSNVEIDSLIATKVKNRVANLEIRSGYRTSTAAVIFCFFTTWRTITPRSWDEKIKKQHDLSLFICYMGKF